MAIDIENDELLTFAQLARLVPSRMGDKTHVATIHRWRHPGLRGQVKLEAIRVGGTWRTTWRAFVEFCDKLTAASEEQPIAHHTDAADVANRDLSESGF